MQMHLRSLVVAALILATTLPACGQAIPVYKDPSQPVEARVNDLFSQLTPDERLSLLAGTGYATPAIPRLGIPPMGMADAGEGVRGGDSGTQGPATLFPSGVDMAQSWDPDLLNQVGHAIGEEARNKGTGVQVLLGPDINIHRSPLGGRDSESFSEDPFLTGQLAVAYIQGMQTTGVAACAKHFDANNEEVDRNTVDVDVSERALREIYLPAFEASVKGGGVYTVMAAYNKVNGYYCTANHHLETDILKDDWGFDGLVMSDWGAVHETVGPVNAGCDLEMPGGQFMTPDKLKAALAAGQITQAEIDDSVKRILRTMIRIGLLNGPITRDPSVVNSPAHQALALEAAKRSVVLLKNDGSLLPLDSTHIHSIAVIGPGAVHLQAGAQGSPAVTPFFQVTPLDGIKKRAGSGVDVTYVEGVQLQSGRPDAIPSSVLSPPPYWNGTGHGLVGTYYTSPDLSGAPAETRLDPQISFFRFGGPPAAQPDHPYGSVRWQGMLTAPDTGTYTISIGGRSGYRVVIGDTTVIDSPKPSDAFFQSGTIDLVAGQSYPIEVDVLGNNGPIRARLAWYPPLKEDITGAVAAAKAADVAVVVVSTAGTDGEGRDRPSLDLPGDQDKLVQAVAAANKNTIVVLNIGSPVTVTRWLSQVPAVVDMGYAGEEAGDGITAVLFGDVNPAGKLTDTFGARRQDYPDYGNFPGTDGTVHYAEGIYVGYRHFDKAGIRPVFPFGYGLSYTTFKYSRLALSGKSLAPDGTLTVTANITNTGSREGAEVAELYVHDPNPKIDKPLRELKGFERVDLAPGETKTVTFTLTPRDFAYFDEPGNQWKADSGTYDIQVGSSERDIKLTGHIRLASAYTAKP